MSSVTVSYAKKNLDKMVEVLKDSHEPVYIAGKKGSAVLVSLDDWKDLEETLYLSSIPGMKESILEGMREKKEDCSEEIDL